MKCRAFEFGRTDGDRHDELRTFVHQVVNAGQHRELALRRQRRFGFVEDVQAVAAKAIGHQGQERLAMRLLVQGAPTIGIDDSTASGFRIEPLDLRRHVEEALGAQEEAIFGPTHTFGDAQVLVQR